VDSKELLERLTREGVSPLTYGLETMGERDGQDSCYCLRRAGASWEVCYLERGSHETLGTFVAETAACDDLFARLDREATARSHRATWFPGKAKADELVAILLEAESSRLIGTRPHFATRNDIRYRVFADGRDLQTARKICQRHAGLETG